MTRIVRDTPWLLRALRAVRELALPDWCIGAGALRNAVWDSLHGHTQPSELRDIDVAYFDPLDVLRDRRHIAEKRYSDRWPLVRVIPEWS